MKNNVVDEGENGAGIGIGNDRNESKKNANELDDEDNAKDTNEDSGSEVDELDNVDAGRSQEKSQMQLQKVRGTVSEVELENDSEKTPVKLGKKYERKN